jgi:hypothetical protein
MNTTWQRLIVHPGDKVQATGTFVVFSDSSATMCAQIAVPLAGDPTACSENLLVPVVGIDPDRLVYGGMHEGRQYGRATVIGTWSAGQIHVEQQFPPQPGEEPISRTLPCSPPAEGWRPDASPNLDQLQDYLTSNAARYGPLWVATATDVTDSVSPMDLPKIAVVPVVGDLESARTELAGVFTGNICLVPASHSLLERATASNELRDLMHDTDNGISGIGSGGDRPIELHMLLLSEELYRKLQPIGLELIEPRPSIVPVS